MGLAWGIALVKTEVNDPTNEPIIAENALIHAGFISVIKARR
jgi:hypothetical protein